MPKFIGTIISRQWHDIHNVLVLKYWLHTQQGPVLVELLDQEGIFFVENSSLENALMLTRKWVNRTRSLDLKSFSQQPVTGFYFSNQKNLKQAASTLKDYGIEPLEADVRTVDRYLMERFITSSVSVDCQDIVDRGNFNYVCNPVLKSALYKPEFCVISFDIEMSVNTDQLFSIAVYGADFKTVFIISDEPINHCLIFKDEASLLKGFMRWLQDYDPDILIGWNCINFDLRVLEKTCQRLNIAFKLGRNNESLEWRTSLNNEEHYFVTVPGRAVLDGIDTLKTASYQFESFSLENVSRELLGKGKLIHDVEERGEEIIRLFREDKQALANYNLEDCVLVWDIFQKLELIQFAIERANMTGLPLDKVGGSVAAFENQYLPRLHRQGYVAPNLKDNPEGVGSPGGYVMDSKPGLYEHVLVLDFKSLYPSIIRSFKIDPYGLVEGDRMLKEAGILTSDHAEYDVEQLSQGFRGAYFKKEKSILPGLIEQLWQARDQAKKEKNTALSQSLKIIMNSFYGVMGTPGCRFFDPRLPSSITLRGHAIMNQTRSLIESKGYEVIYGDTDSIFIWLNQQLITNQQADKIGQDLVTYVNHWWKQHLWETYRLNSALELEYENHYSKFLMPTMRGSMQGTKKRYAGLIDLRTRKDESMTMDNTRLIFKGLENVRTDWTRLARDFQKELYERIFLGKEYKTFVQRTIEEVRQGKQDAKLAYRKRLRRRLNEYLRNIPPHVQAAQKADALSLTQGATAKYARGGWIEYYYTVNGPEAAEYLQSQLDYDLYLERQIAPIVDGIVGFLGTSYEELTSKQLTLL
jgi:DNA polymerase-2